MRKKALNDFEKDFFKLMNNSIFGINRYFLCLFNFILTYNLIGKTMEQVRRRIQMELVSNEDRVQKLINMTTFKYATSYNENLSGVTMEIKIIKFNKPIYIGMLHVYYILIDI